MGEMKRYMNPELAFELIMTCIFNDDYLFPKSKQYQVMEKFLRQVMNESQTFFSDESFKQSSYSQEPQMYNSEDECLREYSMMQVQFFNHMN